MGYDKAYNDEIRAVPNPWIERVIYFSSVPSSSAFGLLSSRYA